MTANDPLSGEASPRAGRAALADPREPLAGDAGNEFGRTLVDQLVQWVELRVHHQVFRPGMRLPSVRQMAQERGISRFTVVEAYERLVAQGLLQARRGAGFFVREAQPAVTAPAAQRVRQTRIDINWLAHNMSHGLPPANAPGYGYLAPDFYDGDLLHGGLRVLPRAPAALIAQPGVTHGYLPLRQTLQRRLAEFEIGAQPEQIVTTSGAIQAIDLAARHFARPGDTVLVGDPAWFTLFGLLALHGVNVVGFPYRADGPDIDRLEEIVARHRPKLMVINSVLHNPTGTTLTAGTAYRILKLAEQYDFHIVEDDIYADFLAPGMPAARLASLDQLQRVVYVGSFSKTLAPNIRVGFFAASAALAGSLANKKMLTSLTTPEINERVVYRALTEGSYRKSCERLRGALDVSRDRALGELEGLGLKPFIRPAAGFFGWFDTGVDTNALAASAQEAGYLLAPGGLFSPSQTPSTWMRCNFTTVGNPAFLAWLARALEKAV